MPSAKILEQKQQQVAALTEKLKNASAGVLVDYKGITVEDDTKLRRELRAAGVEYSVVKNTMLRLAAKEVGLDELCGVLEGTTALALATEDQMAAARIVSKFADNMKGEVFSIKAGFIDGEAIDKATVEAIAKIPSKEALIAKMLGSMNAPIANLAMVIDQIAKKKEEEAA